MAEKWKGLEAFMSPSNNFKKLRGAMAHATRPIIPPLSTQFPFLKF